MMDSIQANSDGYLREPGGEPMEEENVQRKLAAILSADVVGYSRLMGEDELATVSLLSERRSLMIDLIRQHKGRVVDAVGDNLLAEFGSVVDAVQSATAIQKELAILNAGLPVDRRMEFRIGINIGDVIQEGERIYGDGVNIAARLEQLADPGGICISRTAYDQIESKLPFGYEYMGQKTAKNIKKPLYAYRVILDPVEEGQTRQAPRAEEPGEEDPGSFDRVRDKAREFARDISEDEHLRESFHETKDRLSGFVNDMSGDSAGREAALKRIWEHKPLQAVVLLAVILLAINALTGFGRWWFQYPVLGLGLIFYFHWLKNEYFSEARQAELRWRIIRAESRKYPTEPEPAELEALAEMATARVMFYRTLYHFAGIAVFLLALNLLTNPTSWWFQFPVLGMGVVLVIQWMKIPQR